jgi:formylmethanofuran dehydrogenase subunit E
MTEPLPDVLFDDPIADDTFEECDRCGEEILPDDPRYADDEWGIICEDCWVEGGCD